MKRLCEVFVATLIILPVLYLCESYVSDYLHEIDLERQGYKHRIALLERDSVRSDSLLNRQLLFRFRYYDAKTKDVFLYYSVGNSERDFVAVTNLKGIDFPMLTKIIHKTTASGVDLEFTTRALWEESRFGSNTRHRKNSDGTIDGGWFGINPIWQKRHGKFSIDHYPMDDCERFFIPIFHETVKIYDRKHWRLAYQLGSEKLKKIGILPKEMK